MLKVTKVEQIRAIVERLMRERDDVEARLAQARGDLIEAEREEARNAKPTPAMLHVLSAMANGATLHSSRWNLPESYWLQYDGRSPVTVRSSVFDGLRSREAINEGVDEGAWQRKQYSLTDHGRALCGSLSQEGK